MPYANEAESLIAYNALRVDREPDRSSVTKAFELSKDVLRIHFESDELRGLRASINSFMDHLLLVNDTIDKFST